MARHKVTARPLKQPGDVLGIVKKPPRARPALKFEKGAIGLVFVRTLPLKELIFVLPENELTPAENVLVNNWIRTSKQVGFMATQDPFKLHPDDRYFATTSQALLAKFGFDTFLKLPDTEPSLARFERPELNGSDIPYEIKGRILFYA